MVCAAHRADASAADARFEVGRRGRLVGRVPTLCAGSQIGRCSDRSDSLGSDHRRRPRDAEGRLREALLVETIEPRYFSLVHTPSSGIRELHETVAVFTGEGWIDIIVSSP